MIKKITAKIREIESLTKDVKKIKLTLSERVDFKPGQYFLIELSIKGIVQRRAYSIASSPDNKDILELCIKKVSETGFVSELFKQKVGDEIKIIGPAGKFFIEEMPKKDLVFVSVGTGIAPFKSMIEYLLKESNFKKKITLIHGYRHEEDVLYEDYFKELEKQFPNFNQKIILSQPKKKYNLKGHVQDFLPGENSNKENQFYICGMKTMIEDVLKKLNSLGVKYKDILFEKYD